MDETKKDSLENDERNSIVFDRDQKTRYLLT